MDFEHALIVALLLCLVSNGSAGPGNTCQMKCKGCQKMGSGHGGIGSCVSECVQSGNPEGFDCIDECEGEGGGNTCDEVSTNCRNTVEGYECDCKDGYSDRVSDNLCAPNECNGEGGGNACDQVSTSCRNTVEGYACDCKDGYSYRVSDKLCAPNECSGEGGGNACYKFTTDCRNTVEGHVCDCKDGYSLRFTDIMCVPSQCSGEAGGNRCDALSTDCRDTSGGYACDCKDGFSVRVSDVMCAQNECIGEGGGNKCDEKTTNCVDTEKGFTCECKKEFPERIDDVSCEAAKAALVRLVGKTKGEGRVEVFHNGAWGTICDDGWDNKDAKVVCRELELPYTAAQAEGSAFFGQGTGDILLSYVKCDGTESQLTQCAHWGWGISEGCKHINDAGVICEDAPFK